MKRVVAMLLAAGMLLSLCACGASEGEKLYEKYAHIIDRLEAEDYIGVMQEVAILSNSGKEQEEKTPLSELFSGEWYLSNGEDKLNPPQKITLSADGTVTLDGTAMVWVERSRGDEYMSGYLLKGGVHTYGLELRQYHDDAVPYVQLWTLETNGQNFNTDDWVGGYYNDAMVGYLVNSWSNLDNNDQTMPRSFSVSRDVARINDTEYEWSATFSELGKLTAALGDTYTATVELRGEKPVMFLTENASGTTAAYYNYDRGLDRSWPEYIYPRAVKYLNECMEDVANNATPSFWSDLEENGENFSGNQAWKKLYETFTQLGNYKDSAELVGRFTILEQMCTGAKIARVDNLGNQSSGDYEIFKYNAQGQMIRGQSEEIFRMYGAYENYNLYFFYDEAGRLSKVQQGSGNNISIVIAPTYDATGRMIGGDYQSNDYTHKLSYVYDDQGRLVENTVWGGSNRHQYTYTYDTEGRLVSQVRWYGWNSPEYKNYRYTTQFTYDGQGNLTEKVTVKEYYRSWEKTFEQQERTTITYTNDDQGRPISASIKVESDDNRYASQKVTYTYEDLYFFE